MKKEYCSPELEFYRINFIKDVLVISDPDPGVTEGSGSGQENPSEDPFGGEGGW